ncbi:MAG: DUF6600 domain-containing protein [Betaproteobacteria bacterium]
MRTRPALVHCGSFRACVGSYAFAPWLAALVLLFIAAAPIAARADEEPPGRVGRVAEFAGQLYLSAQDRPDDWSVIGINYPVTTGDNLWVSGDGRAEVDYGGGQFRLAGDTSLNVSRLDDRQLALFIARGRLIVRVRVQEPGDAIRIDTPNTQVALTRPGLYRVDVASEGQVTTVFVREGESLIALATGTQQALPGQTITIAGIEPVAADVRSGSGIDGFDSWSANRDRRYEGGSATAYVSRQMVGYAELDENGRWEPNATYGPVWYPTTVASDWTPYSDGYWTNVGAWGLTWVDAAPWGYAPSHYGRWVRVDNRWAWCPGEHKGRPRWAPALVAWHGGASWGVTSNAGAPVYGWVPLGWGDAFQPWWRGCTENCWNRYNRAFGVHPSERPNGPRARYSHLGVPGAMTAVSGATLVGRKPVRGNTVPLPASQTASAPLLATAPGVVPGTPHVPVYRPGERGTPTPASALYSGARRNPGFGIPTVANAAQSSATGIPSPGSGAGATGTATGTATTTVPRIRPAPSVAPPVPPTGASAPSYGGVARAPPSATANPRDMPQQARSVPGVSVPAPVAATAATAAAIPQQPQRRPLPVALPAATTAASPVVSHSGNVGAAGIALPAPQAIPIAPRAVPVAPLGPPVANVGVAPPAPPVVAAPERAQPKPPGDGDASKGGKAGDRNPQGGPATK